MFERYRFGIYGIPTKVVLCAGLLPQPFCQTLNVQEGMGVIVAKEPNIDEVPFIFQLLNNYIQNCFFFTGPPL